MADDINIGALNIPVELDLSAVQRQARGELKRAMERAGKEGADDASTAFLREWRRKIAASEADAREQLARGLIDRKEFDRRGQEAARAYNQAVLKELDKLARSGSLTKAQQVQYRNLSSALLIEGRRAGERFGEGLNRGTQISFRGIQNWIRGTFVVGFLALFGSMVGRAARMLSDLGRRTREVLTLGGDRVRARREFENVTTARGLDPVEVTRQMRAAMRGMADDLTLWRNANTALLSELPVTADKLAEMAYLARRMGKDGAESFDRLVAGIAKGEQGILEELNLMTRLETAVDSWARANGKNADSLSQTQKIAIFFNAVMEEMRRKVALLGPDMLDTGQRVQQLSTWFTNLKSSMAEAIAQTPAVRDFFARVGADAQSSGEKIQRLSLMTAAFAETLVELGRRAADSPFGQASRFAIRAMTGQWSSQAQAASRLTGFGDIFAHELRKQEIRASESQVELLTMQVEALRDRNALLDAGVDVDDERIRRLQEQLELIRQQRREIQPGLRDLNFFGGGTALFQPQSPEDPNLRKKREAIEQQIADNFYALTHSGLEVQLRALDQLEEKLREVGGLTEEWASRIDALREGARSESAFSQLAREFADIQQMPVSQPQLDALELWLQALNEEAAQLPETSQLRERYNELIRQATIAQRDLRKAIDEANRAEKEAVKKVRIDADVLTRAASDQARAIEQSARGALQIAEAIGAIGSEASQALQGVAQLAAALVEISGLSKTGKATFTDFLPGILGAVGAFASIASAISAMGEEGDRRAQEMLQSQVRLIHALDDPRGAVLSDMTSRERAGLLETGSFFGSLRGTDERVMRMILENNPQLVADLEDIQEATGIQFLLGDGAVDWDAFQAAMEAFAELDISGFGDDLTGQLDRIDFLFGLLGDAAGDAADRVQMLIDALTATGNTELAARVQKLFDEGGSDAVLAFLNDLAQQFAAGDESLFEEGGLFFGMTREEAMRWLEEVTAAAQGGGVVGGGSNVQRLAVSITEAQGNQVVSLLGTTVYHLAGIHALLAGQPVALSSLTTAPPAANVITGQGGGSSVINIGDIDVDVRVAGDVSEKGARVLGRTIATEVMERIGTKTKDAWRGAGRLGSPKLPKGESH